MILTPGAWRSPFPELPDPILLEHTCRGLHTTDSDQPILDAVAELADLHRELLISRGRVRLDHRFERHRQRNADLIDGIVAAAVPAARDGARVHTETIGAVADRMACWCAMLHDPAATAFSSEELTLADTCVSQLANGYAALLDELAAGICRVPATTTLTPVTFTGHDLITRRRHG